MDVRKLVKSGNSSLVIALPKDWLKENKLKGGDKVFIDFEKNNLIIKKEHKVEKIQKKDKVVNIDGMDKTIILRELQSAYINNYDHLIIKGKNLKAETKNIKSRILDMIAFDVIDETSDHLVIKNFLNLYDAELDATIRRMDNIVKFMITETKEATKNQELIPEIIERDKEVNKLNFLISKILKGAQKDKQVMEVLNIKEIDILKMWEVNNSIEKIGDRIKFIAKYIPEIKPGCRKELAILIQEIHDIYSDAMKSYYTNSMSLSDQVCIRNMANYDNITKFSDDSCPGCSKIGVNAFNLNRQINDILRIVRYVMND